MAVLDNRYLGIPLVDYFDDFSEIIRNALGQEALEVFARFCTLLGFQLKREKSQVGPAIVFLVLLGNPPCQDNDWKLSISLPEGKSAKWSSLLPTYLKEGGFLTAAWKS